MYQIPPKTDPYCTQMHVQVLTFVIIVNILESVYTLNLFTSPLKVERANSCSQSQWQFHSNEISLYRFSHKQQIKPIKDCAGECKLFRPASACLM